MGTFPSLDTPQIIAPKSVMEQAMVPVNIAHPISTFPDKDRPQSISPLEAQQIENLQWSTRIERLRGWSPGTSDDNFDVKYVVVRFGRHPREFRDALLSTQLAHETSDPEPAWANGAFVFESDPEASFLHVALQNTGNSMDLGPGCVVLREDSLDVVLEALRELRYRVRPRVKNMVPITVANFGEDRVSQDGSDADSRSGSGGTFSPFVIQYAVDSTVETEIEYTVDSTFIHCPIPKSISPRSSYTKSTSDMLGTWGNPRKWNAGDI